MKTIDAITNNPFRVLGVSSNARSMEIIRNAGKIKAFVNVGREVSFENDLKDLLGPICRDTESVLSAQSSISTKEDRVRHSLFWFVNVSDVDNRGLQMIRDGELYNAYNYWQDEGELINRVVVSFLMQDYSCAIRDCLWMIHWNNNREHFLSLVCDDPNAFSAVVLSDLFFKEILNFLNPKELLDILMDIDFFPCKTFTLSSYMNSYERLRVEAFTDSTGEEKNRCIFESANHPTQFVDIRWSLGVLSVSEIESRKESLYVIEYPWGAELAEWDYHCSYEISLVKENAIKQPTDRIISIINNNHLSKCTSFTVEIVCELISDIHPDLETIKNILGKDDLHYCSIAEKVSKTILNTISLFWEKSILHEIEKSAKINAILDYAESLSSSEQIKQICDRQRKEIVAVQTSFFSSMPSLVEEDVKGIISLLKDYYKESLLVYDYSLTIRDKDGNYKPKQVFEKPSVCFKRVESITIDSLLHKCAAFLYSIKQKLYPELYAYEQLSTLIVQCVYNELIQSVKTQLALDSMYLEFENKNTAQLKNITYDYSSYGSQQKKEKIKRSRRFQEHICSVLNDFNNLARFDMDKEFRSKIFEPDHCSIQALVDSVVCLELSNKKEPDIDMRTEREKEIQAEEERRSKSLWERIKRGLLS